VAETTHDLSLYPAPLLREGQVSCWGSA